MLLRIFRGVGPETIFMIVVTQILIWASAFINLQGRFSLYFDLDPMPLYGVLSSIIGTNPLPGIIFTLLLVGLMAFLIVNLNTYLFFINERTFLPAVIFILLSGLFPQYQVLNPAIFGAMFLMLAIRRIMETYRVSGTAFQFFDAGIFIGIGSLFYANLIWFGIILVAGVIMLRAISLKEIIISFIGILTPFVITFAVYYLLGKDLNELWDIILYNLFGRTGNFEFSKLTIVTLVFTGLLTLRSLTFLFMVINTKKIQARKTFSILMWIMMISLGIFFFLPSVSVEIVWITGIPVSYFLAHYFVFVKKKLMPEIIFTVLFLLIIVIQVLYLI
jgi:hypothetical protein